MARTSLPDARSGLVIGYSYLWENEFHAGRDEGSKDRPRAVVIAVRTEDGDIVTTVAPITHRQPADPLDGIELPSMIKRLLGLDDARSWLICAELNRFVWPGPDLRPISRQHPGQFVYGTLARPFMLRVFQRLQKLRKRRRPAVVVRSA
jgi:hypothetical protein